MFSAQQMATTIRLMRFPKGWIPHLFYFNHRYMNAFAHSRLRAQNTLTHTHIQYNHSIYFIRNSQPFVFFVSFIFCWLVFYFSPFFMFKLDENKITTVVWLCGVVHAIAIHGQFAKWSHDVPLWMDDFYDRF